jgi:hypothetical protein
MAELAAELVGDARLTAIEQALFRRRVTPDQPITLAARLVGTRVQASVRCGDQRAAAATLRYAVRT